MNWLHLPVNWLHLPANEASPLADEASPPTDEAIHIGPYLFLFSLYLNVFFLSAAKVLPSESALKNAFSENLC